MDKIKSTYETLAALNVSDRLEKKGKFSYLSWPFAIDALRKAEPKATWSVCRFDGLPFLKTECGFFVEVAVTVEGITLSQIHPVLDNNNRPILAPNNFQINTSIQRCLVKAIALHGLGLSVYAGEDLPSGEEEKENTNVVKINAAHDALVKKLNMAAKHGTKVLEVAWKALEPEQRKDMAEMLQDLKDAASKQDSEIAIQA